MDARFEELRIIATEHFEEIRLLFGCLRDYDLARPTESRSSVRQVAGHIIRSPRASIDVASRLSRGKNASVPRLLAFTVDFANWRAVRKFGEATRQELLAAWERGHNDLILFINQLDNEHLDRSGIVPGLGRLSTYEYLRQSPSHARAHAAEIDRAIGEP